MFDFVRIETARRLSKPHKLARVLSFKYLYTEEYPGEKHVR